MRFAIRLGTLALTVSISLLYIACGGSAVSITGFDQLPSADGVMNSSTASSIRSARAFRGVSLQSVGTPPLLLDLSSSAAATEDAFFHDVADTIAGGTWAGLSNADKNALARQFWGQEEGGPAGNGGCFMAQSVGENLGRILQAATSACYMKKIPNASSGVTTTPSTPGPQVFAKGASDRIIKVNVTGEPPGEGDGGPETVFIRISGESSVGADIYKAALWFCRGGTVNGAEVYSVNSASGVYTQTSSHSESDGVGGMTMTGFVRNNGGNIEFDPSLPRTVEAGWSGSWGKFLGALAVTDGSVTAKRLNTWTYQGQSGTDKNYSIASFTGGKLKNLRFLDGAYAGISSHASHDPHSYSGSATFNETYYKNEDNAYTSQVESFDFAADSFYSKDVEDPDLSAYRCDVSPEITIDMDFGDPAVQKIAKDCEGDRFDEYDMCRKEPMQTAEQRIHQFYGSGGGG